MVELDFDALNKELQESADSRKKETVLPLCFDYFSSTEYIAEKIEGSLDRADAEKSIYYYFDLECTGLKFFVKNLIRKANHFLLFRTVESQRNFNQSILRANRLMFRSLQGMKKQHERDMATIQSLESRIRKLEERAEQE